MEAQAVCPYCAELVSLWIDTSAARQQDYVEDCSVCCRPWRVCAWVTEEGGAEVELQRLD